MTASFTDEALTRPLFEEPTPEIERPDAWSGPHGFLFDAMTYPTKLELSEQFLGAAHQLVELVRRQEYEDYRLTFPVLFLYRHAIELVLKSAIGGDVTGHDLDALAEGFQRKCQEQYGQDVSAWMMGRLKELAGVDPTSTAFRYGEAWDKKAKRKVWLIDGTHVDLYHLQRSMNALHTALADVVGKLK